MESPNKSDPKSHFMNITWTFGVSMGAKLAFQRVLIGSFLACLSILLLTVLRNDGKNSAQSLLFGRWDSIPRNEIGWKNAFSKQDSFEEKPEYDSIQRFMDLESERERTRIRSQVLRSALQQSLRSLQKSQRLRLDHKTNPTGLGRAFIPRPPENVHNTGWQETWPAPQRPNQLHSSDLRHRSKPGRNQGHQRALDRLLSSSTENALPQSRPLNSLRSNAGVPVAASTNSYISDSFWPFDLSMGTGGRGAGADDADTRPYGAAHTSSPQAVQPAPRRARHLSPASPPDAPVFPPDTAAMRRRRRAVLLDAVGQSPADAAGPERAAAGTSTYWDTPAGLADHCPLCTPGGYTGLPRVDPRSVYNYLPMTEDMARHVKCDSAADCLQVRPRPLRPIRRAIRRPARGGSGRSRPVLARLLSSRKPPRDSEAVYALVRDCSCRFVLVSSSRPPSLSCPVLVRVPFRVIAVHDFSSSRPTGGPFSSHYPTHGNSSQLQRPASCKLLCCRRWAGAKETRTAGPGAQHRRTTFPRHASSHHQGPNPKERLRTHGAGRRWWAGAGSICKTGGAGRLECLLVARARPCATQ